MLSYDNANMLLSETIDQLREELLNYAAKPDAKQGFIKKQNKLIANLTSAYNGFQIPDAEMWHVLVKKMSEMRRIDPFLQGFTVFITEKPTGYMARIDLNLCAL